LRSTCSNRTSIFNKINDKIYDKYVFKFVDGIITISESLVNHIQQKAPKKKYIKIPPLVNFDNYNSKSTNKKENYFLFCGSLAYIDVVEFIIKSYNCIDILHNYKLYLVVNGNTEILSQLTENIILNKFDNKIKIYSGLAYNELVDLYINSDALLIPLRETPQDTSRFPQKIAEYCASRKPIITTNIGEIKFYFDNSSAILAEKYDTNEFAVKMKYVIENDEQCRIIAENAFNLGLKYFDYRSYIKQFDVFLRNQ
jgi:glycosyltransferase involved in cell wall biosynthesis